jgi:large exoprotein involved in heme utilization and adhesion
MRLSDGAQIIAETASQNDGNIDVKNANLTLLRRGSLISATAGEGGEGGNINVNSRFIIALPQEDSNIRANAVLDRGGNINITTQGLFGISPVERYITGQSSITASLELGVQGSVNINQPEVQPTQGILELPGEFVDASNQIGQMCPTDANAKPLGSFTVTGSGSFPPNPLQPLTGTINSMQLATLNTGIADKAPTIRNIEAKPVNTIVEAQGLIKTPDGTIELVATAPSATPTNRKTAPVCPTL